MKTFVSTLVLLTLFTVTTTAFAANKAQKTPVLPAWMKAPPSQTLGWCQGTCTVYCASDDEYYPYWSPDSSSCCYGSFTCPEGGSGFGTEWFPGYGCLEEATFCQ